MNFISVFPGWMHNLLTTGIQSAMYVHSLTNKHTSMITTYLCPWESCTLSKQTNTFRNPTTDCMDNRQQVNVIGACEIVEQHI